MILVGRDMIHNRYYKLDGMSKKIIIGMNYYWLISNCSSFFCFRLSLLFAFILSLSLWYLSFVVVLLVPCFLLYTLNSSHYIIFIFLVFLYFVFLFS